METKSIILKKDEASQKKVAEVLKAGGVVIIPTDTVYGFSGISSLVNCGRDKDEKTLPTGEELCADLASCDPDSKIRAIKGRAETKPFIQLISAPEDLALYTDDEIPASLPDASLAIQVSGTFGSRQEEAQRLGRILRPKERTSRFFTLITRNSVEEEFGSNRQKFLAEQGYSYRYKTTNPKN